MSQPDLAFAIRAAEEADGIPSKAGTSYVSQVERGVNVPSRQRALLIDAILGAHGEIARAFGYRAEGDPPQSVTAGNGGDEPVDASELASLVAELRGAIDRAAERDAQQREFITVARDIVALLADMTDRVAANTVSLERIEGFVRWREASLGRTGESPSS